MSNPSKIAYLEISPRMTGKTSRLCALANDLATAGGTVIFVCLPQLAPGLRDVMPGVTVLADGQPVPDNVDVTDATWLYDDFDWLKSTQIRNGAYYATTAARTRQLGVPAPNDLLMELMEANGYRHVRHFLPAHLWKFVREHRVLMSAEDFRLGMLGEFLS
ncbi:hypothetical protein G7W60_22345 [Pseudomonas fluorescens]|uniref:hypothetical protein n=1 Tax=Pseudomonas fluorescens TaxID=294 RepID=UPI00140433CD|nr:hypothetical protein [Pseudomonas fluorescens]NHN70584.1 hypothetical protein [Pseudomonas fluorescens]